MTNLTESVRLETNSGIGGGVALVIVDNPPVNALSSHVRQGLFDGINQAVADGATAIVVICDGRTRWSTSGCRRKIPVALHGASSSTASTGVGGAHSSTSA